MEFHVHSNPEFPTPGQRDLVSVVRGCVRDQIAPGRIERLGAAAQEHLHFTDATGLELRAAATTFLIRQHLKAGQSADALLDNFLAGRMSELFVSCRVLLESAATLQWLAGATSDRRLENFIVRLLVRDLGHRSPQEARSPVMQAVRGCAVQRSLGPAPGQGDLMRSLDSWWGDGEGAWFDEHPFGTHAYAVFQEASNHVHPTSSGPGRALMTATEYALEIGAREEWVTATRALAFGAQVFLLCARATQAAVHMPDGLATHRTRLQMATRRELIAVGAREPRTTES